MPPTLPSARRRLLTAWHCVLATTALGATGADTPLADAAKQQDWDRVQTLVAQGTDVESSQPDGATALHWAAYWNNDEALGLLIDAGANVNAANDYGATPLWTACANRHGRAVDWLLDADADPNRGLRSGETPLMRCAHTGDPIAIRSLIGHGANIDATEPERGQTALMRAAANQHPDVTQALLEAGADVNVRTSTVQQLRGTGERSTTSPQGATYFNAGGFTALLFAARHGDIHSARWLLEAGADVNDTGADGNSALVLATMSGHERLAQYLLERGADPDASGAGYTALHAAVLRAQPDLITSLLDHRADVNVPLAKSTPVPRWTYQHIFVRRETGATPLFLAAKYLEPTLVRLLADAGGDILLPLDDGTTALMAAVGLGSSRSTTRRNRLIAPELVAAEWDNGAQVLATVQAVLDAGAKVTLDAVGRSGNTALHTAARNRFSAAADLLLASGANADIRNENGTTARELVDRLKPN
ncbi:MAG TPA: hypothetical protein DIU48_01115 [Acidobacteria bacterium]|nr:hypothetical protein [Acidobacteriota bacterium]